MTIQLTPIAVRAMTTRFEMADSIRRRSSGFRYWLLMPFAGILIWASVIWTLVVLAVPSRLAARLRLRR